MHARGVASRYAGSIFGVKEMGTLLDLTNDGNSRRLWDHPCVLIHGPGCEGKPMYIRSVFIS